MPKLTFIQPEFAAQSCELSEGKTAVGRSSHNDLVIHDETVSADHCEILVSWNEVIVREHGSRNGTWVAGKRVAGQLPVNHGEVIRFGRVEARLELAEFPVDDASENTAHFLLQHSAHDEPASPQLHAVIEPTMGGSPKSADDGATILVTRSAIAEPSKPSTPAPPVTASSAQPRREPNWSRWILIAACLGALIGAWLWWRSR